MADKDKNRSPNEEPDREEPIVRDKRRIDPETGQVRTPEGGASTADGAAAGSGEEPGAESAQQDEGYEGPDVETSFTEADLDFLSGQASGDELAAERLADLQRVTAEYANYRKRTEANREAERERAVGDAVSALLPVLDDLDRAEKHGDLEGDAPFATIAAKLRGVVERLGAARFGERGEAFDPTLHEAVFQQPTAGAKESTIAEVVQPGYHLGSTLVRPAKVVVAVPE